MWAPGSSWISFQTRRRNTRGVIMLRRSFINCILAAGFSWAAEVHGPKESDSLRFAVIGDSGTGEKPAYDVGAQLAKARSTFPFDFVVMLGDNLYGGEKPRDFKLKFEEPYK